MAESTIKLTSTKKFIYKNENDFLQKEINFIKNNSKKMFIILKELFEIDFLNLIEENLSKLEQRIK